MAAGDNYFDTCDDLKRNMSLEQLFRLLTVFDCNDNPALRVYDQCGGGGGGGGVTPVERTTGIVRSSTSTNVAAGKMKVSISNVGAAAGTVKGVALNPGETVNFEAGNYDTLDQIVFNATGTEFLITTVE